LNERQKTKQTAKSSKCNSMPIDKASQYQKARRRADKDRPARQSKQQNQGADNHSIF
jgi:hypothetical protein